MTRQRLFCAALAAVGCLAAGGCGESAKDVSNSAYILGLLGEAWGTCRQACQDGNPNLEVFRSIHVLLNKRAPRRIQKDYGGSNKQELLDGLKALAAAYEASVVPKLDLTGQSVTLRPGATMEQVRTAFLALDEQYRQLEAMQQR